MQYVLSRPFQGVNFQLPPEKIPDNMLVDSFNCNYRDGQIRTSNFWEKLTSTRLNSDADPKSVILLFQGFRRSGEKLIASTPDYVYQFIAGSWSSITPPAGALTGGAETLMNADVFDDDIIFTNNTDRIKVWTGSGNFADLGGLTDAEPGGINVSAAGFVRQFRRFVFLGNTTENAVVYPNRIRWSRFGYDNQWKNATDGTGQAGYYDVDSSDEILNAVSLGNQLVIYTDKSIYIMDYVGSPFIWVVRKISSLIGVLSYGSIVRVGDVHYFIGQNNIYRFAGASLEVLGSRIFDTWIGEVATTFVRQIKGVFNKFTNEIYWFYPTQDYKLDKVLVYNILTDSFSIRESVDFSVVTNYRRSLTAIWDVISERWNDALGTWNSYANTGIADDIIIGDHNGWTYKYDKVPLKDGVAGTSYAQTKFLDLNRPDILKRLQKIYICGGNSKVRVKVGHCKFMDQPVIWTAEQTISLTSQVPASIDVDITSRYFTLLFTANASDEVLEISSVRFDYQETSQLW